jgi:hypothetical protein
MKIELDDLVRWESEDKKELVQGYVTFIDDYDGEDEPDLRISSRGGFPDIVAWVSMAECILIEKGPSK